MRLVCKRQSACLRLEVGPCRLHSFKAHLSCSTTQGSICAAVPLQPAVISNCGTYRSPGRITAFRTSLKQELPVLHASELHAQGWDGVIGTTLKFTTLKEAEVWS